MKQQSDQLKVWASILGATGVGLGAFGAHGLKSKLVGTRLDNWKTAVSYQLLHSVAILVLSTLEDESQRKRNQSLTSYSTVGKCMAIGTTLFSGSIYLLCLDIGPKKLLGPTTPVGGLLMIAGWTLIGFV